MMHEMSHGISLADVLLNKTNSYQNLSERKKMNSCLLDSLDVRLAEYLKLSRAFSGINDYRCI